MYSINYNVYFIDDCYIQALHSNLNAIEMLHTTDIYIGECIQD